MTGGKWALLPPPADACQVCADRHVPWAPHNPESLYWQTARRIAGEPMPTWEEALAHVSDELYAAWREELAKRGVDVPAR